MHAFNYRKRSVFMMSTQCRRRAHIEIKQFVLAQHSNLCLLCLFEKTAFKMCLNIYDNI